MKHVRFAAFLSSIAGLLALSSLAQTSQPQTENPAQKAIAQLDLAKRNYAQSIDNGKMAAGLARTTLQGIQQAMIKKGIPRISEGASQAQPKVQAFLQQLLPAVEAAKAALPPRGDAAQNEQRALQFMRAMRNFKRT